MFLGSIIARLIRHTARDFKNLKWYCILNTAVNKHGYISIQERYKKRVEMADI